MDIGKILIDYTNKLHDVKDPRHPELVKVREAYADNDEVIHKLQTIDICYLAFKRKK